MVLPYSPSNLLPPAPKWEQNDTENTKGKVEGKSKDETSVPDNKKPTKTIQFLILKIFKSSLTADVMDDIVGRKLSDRHITFAQNLLKSHITFAQNLLKSQFGNINGLECTLKQLRNLVVTENVIKNEVKIFHDWVTIGLLHRTC